MPYLEALPRQKGQTFDTQEQAVIFAAQHKRSWIHRLYDYSAADIGDGGNPKPFAYRRYKGFHVVYQV